METYCSKCGKIATKRSDNCFVCEAGHENWINPVICSNVFIIKDGKVLYGVRSHDPGKGTLDIPGGFVEINESAEEAAIRETKEELGIDVSLVQILGTYPTTYERRPILIVVFIANASSDHIIPSDDMSGGEPVWRDIEDLPGSDEVAKEWVDWYAVVQKDLLAWWRRNQQQQ